MYSDSNAILCGTVNCSRDASQSGSTTAASLTHHHTSTVRVCIGLFQHNVELLRKMCNKDVGSRVASSYTRKRRRCALPCIAIFNSIMLSCLRTYPRPGLRLRCAAPRIKLSLSRLSLDVQTLQPCLVRTEPFPNRLPGC